MIYFEHCLREAHVHTASSICVYGPPEADWIVRDVRDELQDLFPAATVHGIATGDTPPACDLLIVVFGDRHRFPLHDVVYEQLALCERVVDHLAHVSIGAVMLYRAHWRTAEVVPAARLRRRVRQLRLEHRLISLAERSRVLRRLLRPLYGQGN